MLPVITLAGLVGRCPTCRHDNTGENRARRNLPPGVDVCTVREWYNQPGSSCKYHEPIKTVYAFNGITGERPICPICLELIKPGEEVHLDTTGGAPLYTHESCELWLQAGRPYPLKAVV